MYRAVTWKALAMGIDVNDTVAVVGMMHTVKISFEVKDKVARMLLDGADPGHAIREPRVAEHVSVVAAIPEVRHILVQHQRSLRQLGSLVMEGRDIGSVVFPDTPHKFYLEADPKVRAQRRQKDFEAMQIQTTTDDVAANLQKRDKIDSGRSTSPLQIALGATVIENSKMTVDETADVIIAHMKQQGFKRGAATVGH
jgi:cytidylate kinase